MMLRASLRACGGNTGEEGQEAGLGSSVAYLDPHMGLQADTHPGSNRSPPPPLPGPIHGNLFPCALKVCSKRAGRDKDNPTTISAPAKSRWYRSKE